MSDTKASNGAHVSHVDDVTPPAPRAQIAATQGFVQTWLEDIKTYRMSYLVAGLASFGGMIYGWDTGLIGGVLTMPAFQHSFALDPKSKDFANLQGNIVSTLQGGSFFGAAASFYVSGTFGRKFGLLFANVIFIIGSLLQTLCAIKTSSLTQLYIGRFIGGFGVGMLSAVVPTYIGENAHKKIRGRCIGCMQLFICFGILISYFVNYGMNQNPQFSKDSHWRWRIPFACQLIPGAILFVGILFQNESPRWLVEKDRVEEAQTALARVRSKDRSDPSVLHELHEIIEDFQSKKMSLWEQMKAACASRKIFYRVSMPIILNLLQQWGGINSINYYGPQIFEKIGLKGTSAALFATGIAGVVKVSVTALGLAFATEQLGRKYCLIFSAMGQVFSLFYIGAYNLSHRIVDGQPLDPGTTFSIVCVYLFIASFNLGWGPIPYVLSAEVVPNHLRSLTMALALMMQWLCNFGIAKAFPLMLAAIGYYTFIFFGCVCSLMILYAVFCVPETKNIALEHVHLVFEGGIVSGAFGDMIPSKTRAHKVRLMLETDVSDENLKEV